MLIKANGPLNIYIAADMLLLTDKKGKKGVIPQKNSLLMKPNPMNISFA